MKHPATPQQAAQKEATLQERLGKYLNLLSVLRKKKTAYGQTINQQILRKRGDCMRRKQLDAAS